MFLVRPPPQSRFLGRPLQKLITCYVEQSILSHDICPIGDCVYVSSINDFLSICQPEQHIVEMLIQILATSAQEC